MQGLPLQAFLQALQPAQYVYTGNPFMAPQYPAIAPMPGQAPPVAQLPAPENHPIFQALVAATSEQVIKKIDERNAPAAPAKLSPEDEKILVNVLKKGEENKWSMERVFQELSQSRTQLQKHGYTEEVWIRWFMMNVGKLYAIDLHTKAGPEQPLGGDGAGRSSGSSNRVAPETRSVSSKRPTSTLRFVQEQPKARIASSRKVVITTPKPPARSTQGGSSTTSSNDASTGASSNNRPLNPQSTLSGPTLYSVNRSKRGGSVPIVHDQTLIPWTNGSQKPSPPRSEGSAKLPLPRRTSGPTSISSNSDSGTKFTRDEKIFFVHWLRWRLREGPLPEKETLFEELEAELPHRPAEMWKRHWGSHCEVPDGLYIEARKRVEREESRRDSHTLPRPPPAPMAREHSEGSESESESDDDQESTYHPPARKPSRPAVMTAAVTKPKPTVRPPGGLPVMDEDLRAMARYRFAMGSEWDKHRFKMPRWQEFADRPENRKRTREAWYSITRDPKHAIVIDRYVEELKQNEAAAAAPRVKASLPALPQQTRPAASSSGAVKQLGESKPALKRLAADLDNASADGAGKGDPPSKRQKTSQDANPQTEIVDLTADSDGEE